MGSLIFKNSQTRRAASRCVFGLCFIVKKMFMRTCVAAYCGGDVPGQHVRAIVDVHFFMFFQYCILLSYTGTDCPLGFIEGTTLVGKV